MCHIGHVVGTVIFLNLDLLLKFELQLHEKISRLRFRGQVCKRRPEA